MSLRTRFSLSISCTHTKPMDLNTITDPIAETFVKALANGTLADQADLLFHDIRTVAGGANDDIDLTSLSDGIGTALNFARVKILIIVNLSSTKVLTVGAAASNAWSALFGSNTDSIKIQPNGALPLCAPGATAYVVGASSKVLRIANGSGDAANYKIILVGASA